jgi:hypothetical protein
MAKRRADASGSQPATLPRSAESKLEDFAEDLGRLLGSAQAKAEGWISQRKAITEQLTLIRNAAQKWISELSGGTDGAGLRRGPGRRGPRMPVGTSARATAPTQKDLRKKRTISPEGRERIAAAQRARWAKQRKPSR